MTESLKLGGSDLAGGPRIRRLNRLPIVVAIVLVVLFLAAIFYGLSSRGLHLGDDDAAFTPGSRPASTHADQLKEGVPDGIIGEPAQSQPLPIPVEPAEPEENPFMPEPPASPADESQGLALEPEEIWRARLEREQEEQRDCQVDYGFA